MMKKRRFPACSAPLLLAPLLLSACAGDMKLPGVHRIHIQQGNIVEQRHLDRLKPGMDKEQVRFIMGTPAIEDPFHRDRWDYVYTFARRGESRRQRNITVIFEEGELVRVEGDVVAGKRKTDDEIKRQTITVEVPPRRRAKNRGVLGRVLGAVPFVGGGNDTAERGIGDGREDNANEETDGAAPDSEEAGDEDADSQDPNGG